MPTAAQRSISRCGSTSQPAGPSRALCELRRGGSRRRDLQQPLDRQKGQELDQRALCRACARFDRVAHFARRRALDPFRAAAISRLPNLVRDLRDVDVEYRREPRGELRALNDQTHFRIETRRPWVEAERAYEDACAVYGKGLRMQAGRRPV